MKLTKLHNEFKLTKKMLDEDLEYLEQAQQALEDTQVAAELIRQVAEGIMTRAHQKVAELVSRSMSAVFDEPYEFKIVMERKRNQTEARLVLTRGGLEVDPASAAGGGVVDVAAFSLRLAVVLLSQPQPRKFIVLDEPFRFVSRELRPRLADLLMELSTELGIQFLIVTHDDAFEIGTVVQIARR